MTTEHVFDRATATYGAVNQRQVFARRGARLQLPHQLGLRERRFRDHHHTTRVFVEPVHDACTHDVGERGRVMQERVEQCAIAIARARMHDKPRRFIDDQNLLVFKNYI